MGIVDEFARYGAKLVNPQWAVSALTESEFVASLWHHRLKAESGQWIYSDHLSRWSGHGNALFRTHLETALADGRPVRIVVATTNNVALIEAGGDGSKAKNRFKARPDWVGKVASFDGDSFTIVFDRQGG